MKQTEKRKAYLKQWREKNKNYFKNRAAKDPLFRQKQLEYNKKWREKNPEKIRKSWKKYNDKVKDKKREYDKLYYQKNKKTICDYKEQYRNKPGYKEKMRKYRREYAKTRLKDDIVFKLKVRLRERLSNALKFKLKKGSAVKDLGCTGEELKIYLESLFQEGMSWDNYGIKNGQWSIDHIIPLSKVNLENREELLKVCHFSNLRPMWHVDNIKKGNKLVNVQESGIIEFKGNYEK